jgi:hypothetical protein
MRCFFLALVSLTPLLACGTSDPPKPSVGPTSGVDGGDPEAGSSRYLTDLTLAERKKLCDWTAAIGGGYDKSFVCDGGLYVSNVKDQATCIADYLGACSTVTVQEWEACRVKEATNLCALFLYTADECKTVRRCIGKTDGGPPPEPGDGG